jgi:hypothetical protein
LADRWSSGGRIWRFPPWTRAGRRRACQVPCPTRALKTPASACARYDLFNPQKLCLTIARIKHAAQAAVQKAVHTTLLPKLPPPGPLTTASVCCAVGSHALLQPLLATFRASRVLVGAPVACADRGRCGRHNARLHGAQRWITFTPTFEGLSTQPAHRTSGEMWRTLFFLYICATSIMF